MHLHSNTGRHIRSGEDVRFTATAIDLFREYLPADIADQVTRRAKQTYALSALATARAMLEKDDLPAAWAQIRAALGCSRSRRVLRRAVRLAAASARASCTRMLRRSSGRSQDHDAAK
jgi:hypothetical protein